jgi:hypothetical protein
LDRFVGVDVSRFGGISGGRMGVRTFAAAVLSVMAAAWVTGSPEHEKPLWAATPADAIRQLESAAASNRDDAALTRALAQAYVDGRQPGLAVGLVERSSSAVRDDVRVRHVFARALIDQGRSEVALRVERAVLARCGPLAEGHPAPAGCDALLLASAARRVGILDELVTLGVEDAEAHPDEALIAYQNATREARVVAQ